MHILQVVDALPPNSYGGTERYTKHLSEALTARGHTVSIASPESDGTEINERVDIYQLPTTDRDHDDTDTNVAGHNVDEQPDDSASVLRPLAAASAVGPARGTVRPAVEVAFDEVLAETEPDIVHFQHFKRLSATLPLCCQRRGVVSVETLHDFWTICHRETLRWGNSSRCCGPESTEKCARCYATTVGAPETAEQYLDAVEWRTQRLLDALSAADRLIAPSEFLRGLFETYGPDEAEIVQLRTGIRTEQFVDTGFDPSTPLQVGYAGRITDSKGIHLLLSAVNQIQWGNGLPIELGIWGAFDPVDTPYHARLAEIAGDGVSFHGRYDEPSTPYAEMDVFVLPSIWYETSPLGIQEAFASRVPVVTGDIGGMAELVTSGEDGFTFAVGDTTALADRLRRLTQSPTLVKRLRRGIGPPKTLDQHVDDLEGLYAECTGTVEPQGSEDEVDTASE